MSYPERKPIYDTYKEIVQKIIDSKLYKVYAESEIDALIQDLSNNFKSIKNQMIAGKEWERSE
ncbi:MAG: hypothetical protein ACN4EP_09310 [Sediminibacterium sp.]